MLSYSPVRSAGAAAAYFAAYYANENAPDSGEPPGYFAGSGAEALGLSGIADKERLEAVFSGIDPGTGEKLIELRASADAVAGRDFTFSAPKSVSALWAVADPELREKISMAHDAAVRESVNVLTENYMFARRGKGGSERIEAKPIYALFQHSTSRNNDPQLHTHAVFSQMAKGADGKWSALAVDMRGRLAVGYQYQAELAERMAALGFAVGRDPGAPGKPEPGFFHVVGVPETLTAKWSSRRAEVIAKLSEADAHGAKAAQAAAKSTRASKENPNRAANFKRWGEQAQAYGLDVSAIGALRGSGSEPRESALIPDFDIIAQLTETRAAVRETDVRRAVFAAAVARGTAADAQAQLSRVLAALVPVQAFDPRAGRDVTFYATQADIAAENRLPAHVAALRAATHHQVAPEALAAALAARPTLRAEQAAMIRAATGAKGLVIAQGRAGTGKSFALAAVAEAYRDSGFTVRGLAVAGQVALALGKGIGAPSSTLARFRGELDSGKTELSPRSVLIIDEAGMVGSRDMAAVLDAARAARAKVVLVGDGAQLPPVAAGQPFRDAVAQVGIDAELIEVFRQKDAADRDIAEAFRAGDAAGAAEKMRAGGQWHAEKTHDAAITAAARVYASERANGRDAGLISGTIIDTWKSNVSARVALRAEGVLGADVTKITGFDDREIRLAVGDRVLFRAPIGRDPNGTRAAVVGADSDTLRLRIGEGKDAREVALALAAPHAARAEALRAEALASSGETAAQLAQQAELAQARADAAQKHLDAIAYGHAYTVHVSQGGTVKRDALGAGGNVYGVLQADAGLNAALAYVGASRNEGKFHAYFAAANEAKIIAAASAAPTPETLRDYRQDGHKIGTPSAEPSHETGQLGALAPRPGGDPGRAEATPKLAQAVAVEPIRPALASAPRVGDRVLLDGRVATLEKIEKEHARVRVDGATRAERLRITSPDLHRARLATLGQALAQRDTAHRAQQREAVRAGWRYVRAGVRAGLGLRPADSAREARAGWRSALGALRENGRSRKAIEGRIGTESKALAESIRDTARRDPAAIRQPTRSQAWAHLLDVARRARWSLSDGSKTAIVGGHDGQPRALIGGERVALDAGAPALGIAPGARATVAKVSREHVTFALETGEKVRVRHTAPEQHAQRLRELGRELARAEAVRLGREAWATRSALRQVGSVALSVVGARSWARTAGVGRVASKARTGEREAGRAQSHIEREIKREREALAEAKLGAPVLAGVRDGDQLDREARQLAQELRDTRETAQTQPQGGLQPDASSAPVARIATPEQAQAFAERLRESGQRAFADGSGEDRFAGVAAIARAEHIAQALREARALEADGDPRAADFATYAQREAKDAQSDHGDVLARFGEHPAGEHVAGGTGHAHDGARAAGQPDASTGHPEDHGEHAPGGGGSREREGHAFEGHGF